MGAHNSGVAVVREGFPEEVVTEMGQERIGGKWKKVWVAGGTAADRRRTMYKCPDVEGNI